MDLIGQMASVVVVLALLGLSLWWLRRRGWSAPAAYGGRRRLVESLERIPLGPQHTLHLIRLGDAVFLVACSPAGCTVVAHRSFCELAGGPAA
ncbi:MAG TPA: flagellar biosynthetic protein FliO [Bryobacteraceae bacterium]|nr:flagellar biosynthetic protein FliO [Bryobacteraceae bacterium]